MKNPEILLNSFNNKVKKLLSKSIILKDPELENKLKLFFRKTYISELLFEEYVIAISGLQGAGKSTLIKEIYEIDDFPLPENITRGEKLPVMIKEKKHLTSPEMWIRRFSKEKENYIIKLEKIESKNDFMKIATEPEIEDIILEYHIPKSKCVKYRRSFIYSITRIRK